MLILCSRRSPRPLLCVLASFESGEYVRLEKGVAKESLITLNKASYYDPSKNVRYQVIDSVSQLKSEDWNRVVAVFVSGAAWQFAEWPTKIWANPAAIFENGLTNTHSAIRRPSAICCPRSDRLCSVLCGFLFALSVRVPSSLRRRGTASKHCAVENTQTAGQTHVSSEPAAVRVSLLRLSRLFSLFVLFPQLSKTKRHNDRSIALDFWHTLNEFIAARNAVKKLNI